MQKKLIALAVASLVSGAAFAQVAPNNVTMSGIVDMGYMYSSDHVVDGVDSQSAFNDGGHDGSRLKFSGTEDLGNGLKVGFNLDYRFTLDVHDDAISTDNQNLWLGGAFGTVTAGTFGTALDDINGYSETGGMGWGNGVGDMFVTGGYHSNAVKYNSPNFNGLDFMVAYSTDDSDTNEAVGNVADVRAYSARVSYVAGPVKAGLAFHRKNVINTAASDTINNYLLSGSYNFGPVIVGAGYGRASYSGDAYDAVGSRDKYTAYRLGVGVPIGANDHVSASYTHRDLDLVGSDRDAKGFGLSYTHTLSKRTNVYASYGQISQDNDELFEVGYQKAFKVGLRHQF